MIIPQWVYNHSSLIHTVSLPQSGAETGLFSHQGRAVNTKMDLFCPPCELSTGFVVKIINRANFRELYFSFSGVLQRVFFSRPDDYLAYDLATGCH
jgi:hypothetical protein